MFNAIHELQFNCNSLPMSYSVEEGNYCDIDFEQIFTFNNQNDH